MWKKSSLAILVVGMLVATAGPASAKDPKVGKKQNAANGTVVVLTYEHPAAIKADGFSEPEVGEEFAAIEVKACNKSDRILSIFDQQFELETESDTRIDHDFVEREPALNSPEIAKGECVKGWITFSVPDDETVKKIRFTGGGPFDEERVVLRWRVTRDTTVSTTTTLPAALITKAEFDQIQTGMTLDQVNAIVGAPGTLDFESGSGTDYSFASYSWDGAGGTSASVSFQQGLVSSKNQYGLE